MILLMRELSQTKRKEVTMWYDEDKLEFVEKQFNIEKPGCVCMDCGKVATEGEYSCGSCSECGGTIGSECS